MHISVMEYWRWWVVHLWVEGIFEVFATAIIATLFVRMGLLRVSVATVSVLFATIIFLSGGVLGTFHHLYFMQGLNTTANHGHAALFGVYGFLGLGLTLYCMRGITNIQNWDQRLLKISFWSLNAGLAMMTFLSLLPQGLWQTYNAIEHYYAFARSAEFMHSNLTEGLVWARVPGDVVFSVGVGAFALFAWKAFVGKKQQHLEGASSQV